MSELNKKEYEDLIHSIKSARDSMKELKKRDKEDTLALVELMTKHDCTELVNEECGVIASLSTTNKQVFNEDLFLEDYKMLEENGQIALGLKHSIIKTREYVDFSGIEDAILCGDINAQELAKYNKESTIKKLLFKNKK